MQKNLSSQPLSRRGFLAGALSVTGALSLLAGCGGGGGGTGGDVTRAKLIGAWKTVSLSAEGKEQTCPGTLTLTGGDTTDCSSQSHLVLNSDGTYVGWFGIANESDSGTWSLSGTTLTLNSSASGPPLTITVTLVNSTTLTLLNDGVTVNHTKIPDLDRTKLIGKWGDATGGQVYLADGILLS